MLVVLSLVQGVDDLSDACRDISNSAATFDGVVHSLLSVVLSDRSRLSVIDIETLLNGLEVVIATAALFTALQQALDEFVFGDLKVQDSMYSSPMLGVERIQRFGLSYSAGEPVEDKPLLGLALLEYLLDHADDQAVGDKLTGVDIALGRLPQLTTLLDLCAQEVAGGNVIEPELFDKDFTLCSLARAWCSEDH